jgi:hypothetical protein
MQSQAVLAAFKGSWYFGTPQAYIRRACAMSALKPKLPAFSWDFTGVCAVHHQHHLRVPHCPARLGWHSHFPWLHESQRPSHPLRSTPTKLRPLAGAAGLHQLLLNASCNKHWAMTTCRHTKASPMSCCPGQMIPLGFDTCRQPTPAVKGGCDWV